MNPLNKGENANSFFAWKRECFLLSGGSAIFASKSGNRLKVGTRQSELARSCFYFEMCRCQRGLSWVKAILEMDNL